MLTPFTSKYHQTQSSFRLKQSAGFTIVEITVVVVVIGILAALITVSYQAVRKNAVETSIKSDIKTVSEMATLENSKTSRYPLSSDGFNDGQGIKASPGNTVKYYAKSDWYCVSGTANGMNTFNFSSTVRTVTEGDCVLPGNGGVVGTFAGSGVDGYLDGTGTSTRFGYQTDLEVAPNGTIYVPDYYNHRIRAISPSGIVTTIAGSGTPGFANGTGAAAQFNYPCGIAIAPDGNMFVTDSFNHRIRMVTPAGVVTTIAGSGTPGFANGTGAAAQFNEPCGIAINSSGLLFVGDYYNNRIRSVTQAGVVDTFAGSGTAGATNGTGLSAQFNTPGGLDFDSSGNLFVADGSNNLVRRITPARVVTTFAGSGTAGVLDGTGTAARFNYPSSLAIDPDNNIYVSDNLGHVIRKITPSQQVSTFVGSGTPGFRNGQGITAQFHYPGGIAINDSGIIFVSDGANNRIRKIE